MKPSPRLLLIALSASTFLLGACGSGSSTDAASSVPTAESGTASFSDADVLFAQGMIPHHQEAIAMADMALAPAAQANAEIVALATQIKGAQDPEIAEMTALLESWGQPVDMEGMDDDMEGMEGMEGTMSAEDMTALASLTGADFDTAWATAMIIHHEGAIAMAQTVKASGSDASVLTLADAIIVGQQAEIDQMKALLGS